MTPKDKSETGKTNTKTPAIRDLQQDEIDSVSGGGGTSAGIKPPSWVEPDIDPVQDPKSPGGTDPNSHQVR